RSACRRTGRFAARPARWYDGPMRAAATRPCRNAAAAAGRSLSFTSAEWSQLAGLYGVIALLHVAGWGLFLYYSVRYPALVGLGLPEFVFGVRRAFRREHTRD